MPDSGVLGRWRHNGTVPLAGEWHASFDSNFQVLGSIPPAASLPITFAAALSPNASRAYSSSGTVLHRYDLTAAADSITGLFPEIVPAVTLLSDPGSSPVMTISPDGGTLFIAGDAGIVVVPAP